MSSRLKVFIPASRFSSLHPKGCAVRRLRRADVDGEGPHPHLPGVWGWRLDGKAEALPYLMLCLIWVGGFALSGVLGMAFVSGWDSSIRHVFRLAAVAPSEGQPRPDTLFFRIPFGF
jgi:hypothetical protein